MFIDSAKINVRAGDGGDGCIAFRREKYVPKGGPSGGDGGKGGDVVVLADSHIHTLLDFKYQRLYKAGRGMHGQGSDKTGKSGDDCIIKLPVGTVIIDADNGMVICDLVRSGQQEIIANGGKGGKGNARFKSPTNQAPRICEEGGKGDELVLKLELKLLADVGLVGLPNAGKSTLLSRISAAKPKIADYPFTTLVPNLGIVKVREYENFVAADIPGLIEGAHLGKGLGVQFLKHIERTQILLILLDATQETLEQDYLTLIGELESFGHGLELKPKMIVFTKKDLAPPDFKIPDLPGAGEVPSIMISSVSGENIPELIQMVWDLLNSKV